MERHIKTLIVDSMPRRSRRKPRIPQPADRAQKSTEAKNPSIQPLDRRLVEAIRIQFRYLESHNGDAASAIAALDEDMRDRARRISAVGSAHSMFDLLEYVRYAETAVDKNTYRESSHQGSALVVELVALSLAAQPVAASCRAPSTAANASPFDAAQRVLGLGRELFCLVAARGLIAATRDGPGRDVFAAVAVGRELFVRGTTFEHIIGDVLASLFGISEIEELFRREFGFTGGQACEVFLAIRERCDQSVQEIHRRIRSSNDPGAVFPVPVESTFDPLDLAAATGIPTATVEKILDAFCYRPTGSGAGQAVSGAIQGPSPLLAAPILRDGDRHFMAHCGFGLHTVREAVESRLGGTPNWQPYQQPRARFLESEALKVLSIMLPEAQVFPEFHYFAPDLKKGEASGPPERYTKECEADGLLLVDDIALIMEAKSGNLRPQSRRGNGPALEQDLKNLIEKASSQAKRLHDLIERDRRIRRPDGSWLDVSGVRRVHPIAVSLEDLSGFATAAAGLLKAQVISLDFVPWMVSLYDLRVISEIVRRGAELILYIRRRTNPELVETYFAYDELDYFIAFLSGGLRPGYEPHQALLTLPIGPDPALDSGEDSPGEDSPGEAMKFLASHTEPLDNWYMHKHGRRTTPAPRPELETEPRIGTIVDALANQQLPGWLGIGTALLDHDLMSQQIIAEELSTWLNQTRADGLSRSGCAVGGNGVSESSALVLLTMADCDDIHAAAKILAEETTAKRHEKQAAVGAGLLFRPQDSGIPITSCYDNRPPDKDP